MSSLIVKIEKLSDSAVMMLTAFKNGPEVFEQSVLETRTCRTNPNDCLTVVSRFMNQSGYLRHR